MLLNSMVGYSLLVIGGLVTGYWLLVDWLLVTGGLVTGYWLLVIGYAEQTSFPVTNNQ